MLKYKQDSRIACPSAQQQDVRSWLKGLWVSACLYDYSPSLRINKPVSLPFPSTWWQKAFLFELHLSSYIGELMTSNQASGTPFAKHLSLVLILQRGKKQPCIQAIVYTILSKGSSHKCLYLFLQKQMFCIDTVPFQRTHWSFPLRKYWTFSLGQRDRATCWSSAEPGSSDLFLCPWDTEYKN